MPVPKLTALCHLTALIALCPLSSIIGTAQSPRPDEPAQVVASSDNSTSVRALLNEVTLLRLVLQQTNFTGTLAQILTERIRVQQERVERLTRDFEAIRDQISETKLQQLKSAEVLKEVEYQISREQLQVRRNDLLLQQKILKFDVEKFAQQEQRLREREGQMALLVRIEQGKLDELTDKLDTLERDLEKQEPVGKIQPKSRKP